MSETWREALRAWGSQCADAFVRREGILTVYRLYIPILSPMFGGAGQGIFGQLDNPQWAAENPDLLRFLGLDGVEKGAVSGFIDRLASACSRF